MSGCLQVCLFTSGPDVLRAKGPKLVDPTIIFAVSVASLEDVKVLYSASPNSYSI
jgi:hypothetical protein